MHWTETLRRIELARAEGGEPDLFDPPMPTAEPTPQFLADAHVVVANPEQYAHRPLLRRLAWSVLMSARGSRLSQLDLAKMPAEAGEGAR